jgi:hypothetical protein
MAKTIDHSTTIQSYLKEAYGSCMKEFDSIDPTYTFSEFWDIASSGQNPYKRLNISDYKELMSVVGKIRWCSAGSRKHIKFMYDDQWRKTLPAECLSNEDVLAKVLEFLYNGSDYSIIAHDTHRWVSCDGWYEVEFCITKSGEEDNYGEKSIYLHTYCGDQDTEDVWSCEGYQSASVNDVITYMRDDFDYLYAMRNISEDEECFGSLPEDLKELIKTRISES